MWGFAIRVAAVMHAVRHASRRTAVDLVCVAGHVGVWVGLGLAFGALEAMAINYVAITVLNGTYMGAILVVPHVGTGSRSAGDGRIRVAIPGVQRDAPAARVHRPARRAYDHRITQRHSATGVWFLTSSATAIYGGYCTVNLVSW